MSNEPVALELRLAARYRYGALYLLLAAVFLTPFLTRTIYQLFGIPCPLDVICTALLFTIVPASLFFLWIHHWRIAIDEFGVHRRNALFWDHVPWEAFEQGQVRRGPGYYDFEVRIDSLDVPLSFAKADEHLAKQALHLCYAHWAVPPRRPLPMKVTFKVQFGTHFSWWQYKPGTPKIGLSPEGLKVNRKKYAWTDVEKVVFFRPSREHEYFTGFTFNVGGRSYHYEKDRIPESRADAIFKSRDITGYFEKFVPANRIVICTDDEPESISELEERIGLLHRKIRGTSILGIGFSLLMAAINLKTVQLDRMDYHNIVTLAIQAAAPVHVLLMRIRLQNQIKQLTAKRDQMAIGVKSPISTL